jgi:hypothetical protein
MSAADDSKNTDVTTREAFEHGANALLSGVVEVLKQVPGVGDNAPAMAFATVVLPVMGLTLGRAAHRLYAARIPKFLNGVKTAHGGDEQKVAAEAEAKKDDENYQETMFRGFKAMLDAADPAVVPGLGTLTGIYTRDDRKPDAFFRGFGRLLCELDGDELGEFLNFVRAIHQAARHHGEHHADLQLDDVSLPEAEQKPMPRAGFRFQETRRVVVNVPWKDELGEFPSAIRFFALLKREGLALNGTTRWGIGSDRAMLVTADTVRQILEVLDPENFPPWSDDEE